MQSKYVNKIEYSTYILDADMRIVKCDDMFTEITGYTREDIKNNVITQRDLIMEEDCEVYFDMVNRELARSGEVYIEHRIKRKDGMSVPVFCLGYTDIDNETGGQYSVIRVTDITKMKNVRIREDAVRSEAKAQVKSLMNRVETDELTGLLRRGAFIKEVRAHIAGNRGFTMVMLDIDNFKSINDDYGHVIGDDVLVHFADTLRNVLRSNDAICRMGGDEFAILLDGVDVRERAEEIVKRIADNAAKIPETREKDLEVKISAGIRLCPSVHSDVSFEDLYIEADEALYRAKGQGKNRYVVCGGG